MPNMTDMMMSCKSVLLCSDLIDSFPAFSCSLQCRPFCTCMLYTRLQKPFAIDLLGPSALRCGSRLGTKRKKFKKELNRIILRQIYNEHCSIVLLLKILDYLLANHTSRF